MSPLVLRSSTCLSLLPILYLGSVTLASPIATRAAITTTMPADLQQAFENTRYRISPKSLRADNDANHFSVKFSGAQTIIDAGKGAQTTLTLSSYGWGSSLRATGPVTNIEAEGKRLDRHYNSTLSEWFENTPQGLEQGFVVAQRGRRASGPLRIRLSAKGGWGVLVQDNGISLTKGSVSLQYVGLKASDANGVALTSHLRAANSEIEIEVDDTHAAYPLTIDPTYIQQAELTASDVTSGALFGWSVALSSDGNTALVGAYAHNSSQGAAYVFTRSGSSWTQQQELTASDGASGADFGYSVSLSSDGNTALVGASSQGTAYVFTRTASSWTQQQELTASDGPGNQFGWSVALSGDGSTALVAAYFKNKFQGAAYLFTRSANLWTQQQELTASNGAVGDEFGYSVALSNDGSTALVGADQQNSGAKGYAAVFARSGTSWIQQQELTAPDGQNGDQFGNSAALSSDGSTALVGAPTRQSALGGAYVFTRSGTSWTQQQELTASDGKPSTDFGFAVALSSDGNTALISANVPYVFTRTGSAWTQQQELTASATLFDYSVALSGDHNTVLTGAPNNNSMTGNAYVFTLTTLLPQTITFNPVPPQTVGTPLTLGATASSGLPVVFTSNSPSLCTVSGDTATFLAAGSCSITASQAGNTTYQANTATQSFSVSAGPPTVVSLSPSSGSGTTQVFTSVYSDPNGTADLSGVRLLFNTSVSAVNGCYVLYIPSLNQLYLYNNAGTALSAGLTPGSSTTVSNSQCTLSGAGSSYSTSGNNATLAVSLTFLATVPQNVYLQSTSLLTGANSGWVLEGTWGASLGVPVPVSVSPSSGTTTTQTFTAVYSDPNGAADLATTRILFNVTANGLDACYVEYSRSANALYLAADSGQTFSAPVKPGSTTTVSNSQCTLSGTSSSYTTSGNTATLTVALTFTTTPPDNIYLLATETNGSTSGWVQKGTWGSSLGSPTVVSLSPTSGSGTTQTFTAVASDPNGAEHLATVRLLFNTSLNAVNACYVVYFPGSNQLYLYNNAATTFTTAVTPGSSATVSNSQCTLSGTGSSYSFSGDTGTLAVALTFAGTAPQNIYVESTDRTGTSSGWMETGMWGVSAGPPVPVSVSPNSGTGTTHTFAATYTDPNGAGDLAAVGILVNSTESSVSACDIVYNRVVNGLYLKNDAGTALLAPITPGSTATVSNSQCTLSAKGSSYTTSGNTATLTLALTFTGSTAQNVYLFASETNGTGSGFVQEGTWTP